MPTSAEIPQLDYVQLDQEPLVLALEQMKKAYALTLVNRTFWEYESRRLQNFDRRWNVNDSLYLGWVPAKVWDGSTVPRSSLGMPLVFDQVESALPAIMNTIFGSQPEWFQVEPELGVTIQEARDQAAVLFYACDHGREEFGITVRNDVETAVKCMLIYGYGGLAIEWDDEKQKAVPSWVDTRDIYFDPGLQSPAIDYARSVIRRATKTIQEIVDWKGVEGMSVPTNDQLWAMAQNLKLTAGDQTKQVQNALAGTMYTPGYSDFIPNPSDRMIEVLTYWSKSRVIVVLNREWVAWVGDNPYGCIPFCFAPCYTVPGRSYPLSIGDVQEGNQRYIEALMNLRIDELHMSLIPPRAQKASSTMTPSQQRWRPGALLKLNDPSKDITMLTPPGATTNVMNEVNYVEGLAEKRTGISSMSQGGGARPSNANRTASGMQMQQSGSSMRLYTLVKHVEDYMLVPMLYKMVKMYEVHTTANQLLPGRQDNSVTAVSSQVMAKPVRFKITASSQMITRDKLMQLVPFLLQYMANGAFVQGLNAIGQTIDWNEFYKMVQDATGIGKLYTLVRPLTPEETKAKQQPTPQQTADAQANQQDAQTRMQLMQMKVQGGLQEAQMAHGPKPPDPAEQAAAQQKAFTDQQSAKAKMETDQQTAQLTIQMKQMELQFKQQELAMKQQSAQMDAELKSKQMQMDAFFKQYQGEQDMKLSAQKGAQDSALSQQKMDLQSQQNQQDAERSNQDHGNAMREGIMAATLGNQQMGLEKKQMGHKEDMLQRKAAAEKAKFRMKNAASATKKEK